MPTRRLGFRRRQRFCEVRVEIENGVATAPRVYALLKYQECLYSYNASRWEEIGQNAVLANLQEGSWVPSNLCFNNWAATGVEGLG